ncbi:DUF3017 domain-containing protein [Streptomyces sp. NBC_00513]|uniref:DUF3017 domain-containing protein n=1 Tax=unclassified Streptomyces TaxID=2593676 RepID=UPI0006ADD95C|nr:MULTISPECIES: DUF3017 domain-containing protein [unclassified Streptomyces]MCX5073777.1 DUF3017 domain-containing protein [Streptomyces sp. NBC_00424]WUD42999.1 DUF3017 domain-containing protein [Streptomyces sp. NBC_00513]
MRAERDTEPAEPAEAPAPRAPEGAVEPTKGRQPQPLPVESDAGDAADAADAAEPAEPVEADAAGDESDAGDAGEVAGEVDGEGPEAAGAKSRRFPSVTRDTARPEGGGRAAPGGAPAPARQWPMLSVLAATAIGLLTTAIGYPRVGCLIIGAALIAGAVMRWILPSVGMLAVRSRFTDMVTYGLLGASIILLALVVQAPKAWLEIPFLTDVVRFTVR